MLNHDNLIGKYMFPELDNLIKDWNNQYLKQDLDRISNYIDLVTLYQKLCELTSEEISKFIEKFEEIKNLLKK